MISITIYVFANAVILSVIAYFSIKKAIKNEKELIIALFSAVISSLVIFYISVYWIDKESTINQGTLGPLGDYFGGILNPIIGGFSAYLLFKNLQVSKELCSSSHNQVYTDYMLNIQNSTLAELKADVADIKKSLKETRAAVCVYTPLDDIFGIDTCGQSIASTEYESVYEFCKSIYYQESYYYNAYKDYNTNPMSDDVLDISFSDFLNIQLQDFYKANIAYSNFILAINIHCNRINRYLNETNNLFSFIGDDFLHELFRMLAIKTEISTEEVGYQNFFLFLLDKSDEFKKLYLQCRVQNLEFDYFVENRVFR